MKCPLFREQWRETRVKWKAEWADCLQEECAWWDQATQRCIAQNISEKMSMIYVELTSIRTQGEGR